MKPSVEKKLRLAEDGEYRARQEQIDKAREDLANAAQRNAFEESEIKSLIATTAYQRDLPTWQDILYPAFDLPLQQLHAYCSYLGYDYAVYQDRICFVGTTAEGMIETGIVVDNIPVK